MAKTPRLPKRVAGVKLPKSVRESGGKLRAMFASEMAKGVLEKVISAAVIAFAAKLADSKVARDAADAVGVAGEGKRAPARTPRVPRKTKAAAARTPGRTRKGS